MVRYAEVKESKHQVVARGLALYIFSGLGRPGGRTAHRPQAPGAAIEASCRAPRVETQRPGNKVG